MKQKKHTSVFGGRSTVFCTAIGVAVAVIVTALLSAGLTSLVMNGTIAEKATSPYIFVIRLLAVLFGGLLGAGLSDGKILPVVGLITGVYIVILLSVGIAAYDGSFYNFGTGLFSTLIGGVIACLIKLKPQMRPKRAIRYTR